jgi:glycerophosphoryl diester phosphodiesterase
VRGFSLNWQRLAGRLGFIAAAHAHDMIVHVWTVNESEEMRAALEAGVDGVGTDYPALLAEMIAVALPLESPGEMVQFKCG